MATKNIMLQMKLESVLTDLMVRTGADNVIVDSSSQETLATRLASIASKLNQLTEATGGAITQETVEGLISTAIDELIDGAPGTYDTLKEIAGYIQEHEDVVTSINAAIANKVDKVDGKQLSTEDFTTALLNKLNAISEGANKVEASDTNGYIKIDGSKTKVYTHPTGDGNNHLPTGGTVGQVLRASGSGAGTWGSNVRSGVSEPGDLAEGELFIKLFE